MCIILVVPKKKKLPDEDTLRRCFKNNPDGCGLMYLDNESVIIKKGMMDEDIAISAITAIHQDIGKKSPLVIHFRIGTSGKKKDPVCCHPFPISNNYKDLYKLQTVCDRALAHNGIIYQYESTRSALSDTMFFTKMLSGLTSSSMIKRALNGHNASRFVYLSSDGTIIRTGIWNHYNGCFYSNENHLPQKVFTCMIPPQLPATMIGQAYLDDYEEYCNKYKHETFSYKNLSPEEKEKQEKFSKWLCQYEL
jgi:predicted glutamine amidotransferase